MNRIPTALFYGNQVARPGNLIAFRRMSTQEMPVRGRLPDEVKGPTVRKIGLGFYESQSDEAIGRIEADTSRVWQPRNHVTTQTFPGRFGIESPLGPHRADGAWEAL